MFLDYLIYYLPFVIAFILSLVVIPKMQLSFRGNNSIGGVSIFPLLLMTFCAMLALPDLVGLTNVAARVQPTTLRLLQLIVGLSILYIIGVKNDLHGTSSLSKFLALLAAACLFPVTGLYIKDLHGLFGIDVLPVWAGMTLTVLMAIYITELFKLLDGADGLASGLATLAIGTYLICSIRKDFAITGIGSSATLGITATFWLMKISKRRNRTMILGGSGSYILGYMISYLAIVLSRQEGGRLPEGMLLIILSAILIPSLDILRVVLSRVRDKRAITLADKNQVNHKLIRTGLSRMWTAFVLFGLTMLFVGVTTLGVLYEVNPNIILITDIVLFFVMHFVLNYFISKNKNKSYFRNWKKEFGKEAWNSAIPKAKLDRKKKEFGTMGLPAHIVEGNDIHFIPDGMNALERNTKRLFDLLVATFCLIVFSPLFLLSYILIKLDDGGPAIYRQERIGRFGRPFYILKYRSMRLDAEKFGPALSHAGGDDDPRLTKVGKFLRAHHLDELPQLWNVFKGDMAFIGYRPERKFFIDQIMDIDPRYAFLYQIRPGVTSYATLYNGYTDTMEKMQRRLELDLYYLGHRSWWLDIKVLFLTFLNIFGGKKF